MAKKTTSQTITMHPLVGCITKAEDFLGADRKWEALSDDKASLSKQTKFLELCLEKGIGDLSKFSEKEFESISSLSASAINSFLAKRGFNITLDDFDPKEGFATASVLKVLLEWREKGIVTDIYYGKKEYPAVSLNSGRNPMVYWNSEEHNHPILEIVAKNNDRVFMTISDESLAEFELLEFTQKMAKTKEVTLEYKNAIFPMITYDEKIDIDWIIGMRTRAAKDAHPDFADQLMAIKQAKQQTKFRMNEIGAKVESAAAMGIMKCVSFSRPSPPLIIDKPFVLWVQRNDVSFPYFAAYFAEDSWKKPESLE